jgi:hypothetical protein
VYASRRRLWESFPLYIILQIHRRMGRGRTMSFGQAPRLFLCIPLNPSVGYVEMAGRVVHVH